MNRLFSATLFVLMLIPAVVSTAEEPQREWLDFFEGQWDIDWDGNWALKFQYTKGKSILYGETTTPSGDEALAVYAWDAGKKALVFTWFDSKGNHTRQEYTVFKENALGGLTHSSGPDGITTGSATIERFGADAYKVTLKNLDANGKLTETSGKLTRRK